MVATLVKPATRLTLDDMTISTGKKVRLHRLLYQYGPGNGTMMILPIDQGLEHGPMDFFVNPPCEDPNYQYELAVKGNYSGIALHIGLAEKYYNQYAGKIPLVLKVNGKTCVPNDEEAFSPLTSSVEDAVRLGADAIGYTIYVGSPSQEKDIRQFNEVRREAERFGMPVIVWAYPRGRDIDAKGGKNSFYSIDYAARVACELGADVVKVNYPDVRPEVLAKAPAPYNTMQIEQAEAVRKVVQSAGNTMVIFSGGSKVADSELVDNVRLGMEAGANGIIFGRNMWQRPMEEALRVSAQVNDVMRSV